MKIENNILYGDTVGSRENVINKEEYASDYEYLLSFENESYLRRLVLNNNTLLNYNELLLVLCRKSDNLIINALYISKYDICKMINNYEFNDASYLLEKLYEDIEYSIAISIKDENQIYVTCDDKSKGYLFGKIIVEEDEDEEETETRS